MMRTLLTTIVVLSLFSTDSLAAPGAAKSGRAETIAEVTAALSSPEADVRARGMEGLKTRCATTGTRVADLRAVVKTLVTGKRWEELLDIAQHVVATYPGDFRSVEAVLFGRVKALLGANKPQDALVASKSLFNVASMEGTSDAILLVAECLIAARPDDRLAYEKFKEEQMAGASTQPTTRPVKSVMLAGIKVEPRAYDQLLDSFQGEDYAALLSRGNLMLLADKLKEARLLFERMYTIAQPYQLAEASECLARLIRAEDGTIGRANIFVYSIRPRK